MVSVSAFAIGGTTVSSCEMNINEVVMVDSIK